MRCPKCGFDNPTDSHFCNKCGTQIPAADANLRIDPVWAPLRSLPRFQKIVQKY